MSALAEIDVILLSWNRAAMTIETIRSVADQEGVSPVIWVVDQNSIAGERRILKEGIANIGNIPIHLHQLEQNVGVPGGRNIGMFLGQSRYTVGIDNDAVFESTHALKKVVDLLDNNPGVGALSFRIKNFYTGKDDELSWVYPKMLTACREKQFLSTRFVGCGHAIRRDVFETTGGYDEKLFFYWEETDLSYRIINAGYSILYYPEIIVRHKVSPEARIKWEDGRFYFLVRNALYIDYKYNRSLQRVLLRAAGYLVKGFYNRLPLQTVRGLFHSIALYKEFSADAVKSVSVNKFTPTALRYLQENEDLYRGSFWQRVSSEVFTELPGRR